MSIERIEQPDDGSEDNPGEDVKHPVVFHLDFTPFEVHRQTNVAENLSRITSWFKVLETKDTILMKKNSSTEVIIILFRIS